MNLGYFASGMRETPDAKCWHALTLLSAYSITLDVGYALFPIFTVSNLQMSLQKKIVVCASLGLGIP